VKENADLSTRRRDLGYLAVAVLALVGLIVPAVLQDQRAAVDYSIYPPPNRLKVVVCGLYQYHDDWGSFPPIQSQAADGQATVSWRWTIRSELDRDLAENEFCIDKPSPAPRVIRSDRGSSTDVLALCRNGQWNVEFDESAVRANGKRILCVGGSPLLEVPWTSPIEFDLDQRGNTLVPAEWLLLEDGSVVRREGAEIEFPNRKPPATGSPVDNAHSPRRS
jgi:hypothetical protein